MELGVEWPCAVGSGMSAMELTVGQWDTVVVGSLDDTEGWWEEGVGLPGAVGQKPSIQEWIALQWADASFPGVDAMMEGGELGWAGSFGLGLGWGNGPVAGTTGRLLPSARVPSLKRKYAAQNPLPKPTKYPPVGPP
ncbi:uncharacterized protein EI90DRAFT_3016591 [Cantharellus anzutake]|uniref:uncharacterized protein n=1 Tax=Cantharellus anzutake TaxID=1750568 RepID=UPI0019044CDB|nr:uncharacterized protein EI90DRAFT_3016591 [Cantharellus anzutake]KAF8330733.1 hypothetical protein EI90DRAFT_3016591 [Cantharellus anzutake]